MIIYEDECVGCPKEMGCLGDACSNMNVPHYYCDRCGEEFDPDDTWNITNDSYILCDECWNIEMQENVG